MLILNKKGNELYVLLRPEENLRIGECLDVGGMITQVIDLEYATLPGILEHILRKSMLAVSEVKEAVQEEVESFLGTLTDHKMATTKIRGMIVDGKFKVGFSELTVSRSNTPVRRVEPEELLKMLNIQSSSQVDFATLLTEKPIDFKLMLDKLGINLITGMKGSGKSYSTKKILLRLIEKGKVTIVFDLNGEYLNLWKDENGRPGVYAQHIKVLNPRSSTATMNVVPFRVPLNEISYDDFAEFTSTDKTSQMYNELIAFWNSRRGSFDLNDLEQYVAGLQNEFVRTGLQGKIRVAKAMNLFGPFDITSLIAGLEKTGGAIIVNLTTVSGRERRVLVEFILHRLSSLGRQNKINPLCLFVEEAQLYITKDMVDDLLTRMRHYGIFPTFITNDPRTLPSEVFSLCDNLMSFRFHNPDDLNQIAKAKMIDLETLELLKNIEDRQCIMIGNATNNFPLVMEVKPEPNVMMGGETRKLFG